MIREKNITEFFQNKERQKNTEDMVSDLNYKNMEDVTP